MNETKLPTKDSTPQEIFDYVVARLRAQGEKSEGACTRLNLEPYGGCLYRGPRGLKCAAGHLIPDAFYDPDMEGRGVAKIPYFLDWSKEARQLVDRLQVIHDNHAVCDWEMSFAELAEDFGLAAPPPEKP